MEEQELKGADEANHSDNYENYFIQEIQRNKSPIVKNAMLKPLLDINKSQSASIMHDDTDKDYRIQKKLIKCHEIMRKYLSKNVLALVQEELSEDNIKGAFWKLNYHYMTKLEQRYRVKIQAALSEYRIMRTDIFSKFIWTLEILFETYYEVTHSELDDGLKIEYLYQAISRDSRFYTLRTKIELEDYDMLSYKTIKDKANDLDLRYRHANNNNNKTSQNKYVKINNITSNNTQSDNINSACLSVA